MPVITRAVASSFQVEGAEVPRDHVTGNVSIHYTMVHSSSDAEAKELRSTLLYKLFGERIKVLRSKQTAILDARFEEPDGSVYELLTTRVRQGEAQFWGGSTKNTDWFYIETKGVRAKGSVDLPTIHRLDQTLEEYANFGVLTPRKAVARLELLTSPAAEGHIHELLADDFELVDEPFGESGHELGDGCCFVPQAMLDRLGLSGKSAIQVRVLAPRLGLFKGVLACKPGITKIQLSPSMRKVPPSETNSHADWALLLVCKQGIFPSKACITIGRRLLANQGEAVRPLKTPYERPLSKLLKSLWEGQGVPTGVIQAYCDAAIERYSTAFGMKQRLESPVSHPHWNHASLVGLRDPTDQLPAGTIYVPGLPRAAVPLGERLFVTRYPCVKPADGPLLPLVVDKPASMSQANWNFLAAQPFGAIYFSTAGPEPIPMACAKGDLDGDLYVVCWDASLVEQLSKQPPAAPFRPPPAEAKPVNNHSKEGWLQRAQAHIRDPSTVQEAKDIGRYYTAWQKAITAAGSGGVADADAIALGEAYAQTLECGKHGGVVNLPSHLEGLVRKASQKAKTGSSGHTSTSMSSSGGGCEVSSGGQPAAGDEGSASDRACAARGSSDDMRLGALSLAALRKIIDDERLPVKKNVGGVSRRTKEQIVEDVRRARADADTLTSSDSMLVTASA